jgi:hypothetical protein
MNKRWWLPLVLAAVLWAGTALAVPQPDEGKKTKPRLSDKLKDLTPPEKEGPAKTAPVTAPAGPGKEAEVTTPVGNLGVGLALKTMYSWSAKDNKTMWPGRDEFTSTMVDLNIRGRLSDNIDFRVELAASWNPDANIGGFNGFSNPGEVGTVGVRQASITFHDLIPWTTIEVGTFIPPLTNYGPRAVTNLDLIMYPLLNNGRMMDTWAYTPRTPFPASLIPASRAAASFSDPSPWAMVNRPILHDFSPWQQAGFNITVQTPYMLRIDFGMWNGMMKNHNANVNDDDATATSVKITFQPDPTLTFSAGYWGEQFDLTYQLINVNGLTTYTYNQGGSRKLDIWYLSGAYLTDTLEITADYAQGGIPDYTLEYRGVDPNLTNTFYDLRFESWQVTAGYWFLPQLELLFRYEQIDPNTIDTIAVAGSCYDRQTWFTMGLNYRIIDRAEVSINYVIKTEQGREIEKDEVPRDPTLLPYNPKYTAQKNDLLMLQVMVWQ